jgi:hypothetical protein
MTEGVSEEEAYKKAEEISRTVFEYIDAEEKSVSG